MPFKDRGSRKAWFRNNPEQQLKTNERARKGRKERFAYIQKFKDVPCKDCGIKYPPYVMDFDHVRDEKFGGLAHAADNNWSYKRIDDEIAKCDVVCSNCHRERTWGHGDNSSTEHLQCSGPGA